MKKRLTELLEKQWNNKEMVDHCIKDYKYIELNNKILEIGSSKPTITKQLWFDDEKPIPEKTKEQFIYQNMLTNAPRELTLENNRWEKLVLIVKYSNDKTDGTLIGLAYGEDRYPGSIIVTEEQLEIINSERRKMKSAYEKRLESYWNRYNQHIRFSGYWVNR